MFIWSMVVEPQKRGMSNCVDVLIYEGFKMKYHQKNDDTRFVISLALVTILAILIVAVG